MPRWRQDLETGKFVEIVTERSTGAFIRDDIQPYVSPVDGTVISSRSAERQHNSRHGVSNDLDSLREQSAKSLERKSINTAEEKHQRKLAIKDSIERASSSGYHRHIQYER